MKITAGYVAEYKKVDSSKWHDAAWHSFMSTAEADSVSFAIWEAKQAGQLNNNEFIAEVATAYSDALGE